MDPIEKAKLLLAQYYNRRVEELDNEPMITTDDVKVVWFCYILGGWKCLLINNTKFGYDGAKYYEITYNVEKAETYIDTYMKVSNLAVPDGEVLHWFDSNGSVRETRRARSEERTAEQELLVTRVVNMYVDRKMEIHEIASALDMNESSVRILLEPTTLEDRLPERPK